MRKLAFFAVLAGAAGCAQLLGLDQPRPLALGAKCGAAVGEGWLCGPGLACNDFTQTCELKADCIPAASEACYSGAAGTEDVGPCHAGTRTCGDEGTWGPCVGEVVPAAETCLTPVDDDCDGQENEEGDGCVCVPDTTGPCYTGPAGTEGVGACAAGSGLCNGDGTGTVGACSGEVLPGAETCGDAIDEDCSGYGCGWVKWARLLGADVVSVAPDAGGALTVAGTFDGPTDFGDGNLVVPSATDAFVARYDPSGALVFVKPFAGVSAPRVGALADGIAFAGTYVGNLDLGCGGLPNAPQAHGLVARLDASGACVWSHEIGGTAIHHVTALTVPAGAASFVVVGWAETGTVELAASNTADAGDVFFGRFDGATGALTASFFSATPQTQTTGVAAADPNGNYAFLVSSPAGLVLPSGTVGNPGALAVRVGTNDAVSWVGSTGAGGVALAMGGAGEVYVADWALPGTYTIASSQVVVPPGGANVWVVRFKGVSGNIGTPSYPVLFGAGGDVRIPWLAGAGGEIFLGAQGTGTPDFGLGPVGPTQSYDVLLLRVGLSDDSMPVVTPVWNRLFGGPSQDAQVRLAAGPDGALAFTFGSAGDPDVGLGPMTGQGEVIGMMGQ